MTSTEPERNGVRKHPPLTGWGKASVIIGILMLGLSGMVLFFSDATIFDHCTTVTEKALDASKDLKVAKEVKTCSPSTLSGGVPLILAAVGGAFVAPGLLRLLPPGKYTAGWFEADTSQTSLASAAKQIAEQGSAQMEALRSAEQPASPPAVNPSQEQSNDSDQN